MNNSKKVLKSMRMTAEFNDKFEAAFEESNFDSKGEYFESIFDKANKDEPTVEIEEVEVEKKLEPNQLLISLTPAQHFILREHVTRDPNFAQEQNRVIDKLANKPWWGSNDAYKPEFQELWVRSIELAEEMEETEKKEAIKHNMSAFILNMFLIRLVSYDLQETKVSTEDIETFIHEQTETSKIEKDEQTTE
jgi:hypothetical protein